MKNKIKTIILLLMPFLLIAELNISSFESIKYYIENGSDLKKTSSYFDTKTRAAEVCLLLREELALRHKKNINAIEVEYSKLKEDMPNSIFPGRRDLVIENVIDSYNSWKKYIDAERNLIIEDYMGGTGAYYAANLFEIKKILEKISNN